MPKKLIPFVPFILVVLALVTQHFLGPLVGSRIFLLLYPAVFLGSFFGVFWSSMFATIFASISACVLLFSGQHTLHPEADTFGVLIFFFSGFISIYLGHSNLVQKLHGDELKHAVSSRDEFLTIASHELKTPITSLKLQLQMTKRKLLNGGSLPKDKLMKSLDVQEKQVTRLTQLVEELLNVTRIQAGKFDYSFEEVDLGQLVHDITDRYADEFKAASCKLSLSAPKDLIVRADPFRLDQVIVNLITNALKYAPGTSIEIHTIQDDRYAKIIVKDTGKGISADKLMKIFDRFERAEVDSNITGLGLGLYIVKEIVTQHYGRVSVESELNRGSTFTVEIPLAKQAKKFNMDTQRVSIESEDRLH